MISIKKENMKDVSDRQLSSNEIEKVLELQNSTLLRRLPSFAYPEFSFAHNLGLFSEDGDSTDSSQHNVDGMLEQQKILQNLLKHYQKSFVMEKQWLNPGHLLDLKYKKRFETESGEKRDERDKTLKASFQAEEAKTKLRVKKEEDGKVFSKQRKTNFTSKEVETLLDCVRDKKEVILFGVAGGRGWAKAWQDIAKVVTKVEGIQRSEGDVRKKWTYLKWEAKNTSKPGRDPVSKQVLNILTSRDREVQEAMSLRNLTDRYPEEATPKLTNIKMVPGSQFRFILPALTVPATAASVPAAAPATTTKSSDWHQTVIKQEPEDSDIVIKEEPISYDVYKPQQPLFLVPPANPSHQPQQQTPQPSPQAPPHPSPPPAVSQKKSSLPPLAPKPTVAKLPQGATSIKQPPKLLPKPQSPPEVCLRWNSYHSNMQNTFPSLLNNEQFVDVTLACDGRSIKCHKVMLSACSPYMEELLSSNPCQHPIIFLKDMKFWQLQALVDFMYRGEVNVTQDKLPSLLSAAEALQIKGLASPVNHSAPPKITQVQPMPTSQHDVSDDMDQVTYMRQLQLKSEIKNEYEDEYMQDTDESPPPTPKLKKRKMTHSVSQSTSSSNGTSNSSGNKHNVGNKIKREKEHYSEPSTSQHILNTAQALLNQKNEQRRKSDADKLTDSDSEYKNYSEDNRHHTNQDEDLDIDEEHAQIILERYSSQNEDCYSRGGDGDADDNSTTSG